MADNTAAAARGMSYNKARQLLLGAGLVVLLVVAAVMYARRVDPVEVGATLLFIPIFIAFVFWDIKGGVIAGILAALAYGALRYDDIQLVGAGRFGGLIASRSIAFLAFGLIGGWATRQLESSLTKLELYDQIDDATGLYNARFFVQDTDLEMSRSKRYQTIFSVVLVDVPAAALDGLARRQRDKALRDLGRMLQDSVRTVDRGVHGRDENRHRFAVVLPETGPEGARIFIDRFADRVAEFLRQRGANVGGEQVARIALTFPEDETELDPLRQEFAAIDRLEHPEASEAQTA